jgi:putative SOS response-associated peptidase YedK
MSYRWARFGRDSSLGKSSCSGKRVRGLILRREEAEQVVGRLAGLARGAHDGAVDGARGEGDLVQRRWSWPGQNRRPVYNFRSEGREFTSNRCLIVADGFYEFTDPTEKGKKRKDK